MIQMKFNISKATMRNVVIKYIPILFTLFLLVSCSSPKDELEGEISSALRDDNAIDEEERKSFNEFINENKEELVEFYNDGSQLDQLILEVANRRRNKTKPKIYSSNEHSNQKNIVLGEEKVQVFIENSGSMDGYVKGITGFENVVGKLLVLSKHHMSGDIGVNFINNNIYPAPEVTELTDFAKSLEPEEGSMYYDKTKGDRSQSKLNNIIKQVLDSTMEGTISILVSDCIYSLGPDGDTKSSLGYQQNGTMEAFLTKFRNSPSVNLSTCIFKMISNYNGRYFPYNYDRKLQNSITIQNGDTRPYYIWVIGNIEAVNTYLKKVKIEKFEGFQNSYILANTIQSESLFYTILSETNKKGNFRPAVRGEQGIKSIEELEYGDNGKVQFSVAVDFSKINLDESYFSDLDNYQITTGFKVKSIEKFEPSKVAKNDFRKLSTSPATHFFTVEADENYAARELKIELSSKIPLWVEQSNTIDDTNVRDQLDKTFGLSYLIRGVSDAYLTQNEKNQSYFTIKITIN